MKIGITNEQKHEATETEEHHEEKANSENTLDKPAAETASVLTEGQQATEASASINTANTLSSAFPGMPPISAGAATDPTQLALYQQMLLTYQQMMMMNMQAMQTGQMAMNPTTATSSSPSTTQEATGESLTTKTAVQEDKPIEKKEGEGE